MTEADILQAITSLIECTPETLESVVEYIRNTEQFCEFMEALDNTEDVIEKLKEMLQEIVEKKPPTAELEFSLVIPTVTIKRDIEVLGKGELAIKGDIGVDPGASLSVGPDVVVSTVVLPKT